MRYRTAAGDVAIQKSADGYRFYLYDDAVPTVKLGEAQANELLQEIKNGLEANEAGIDADVDNINASVDNVSNVEIEKRSSSSRSVGVMQNLSNETNSDLSVKSILNNSQNVKNPIEKNAPEGARMALKSTEPKVVKLNQDSDLYREIKASGKSVSSALKDYIIRVFGGKEIKFSDGRTAIIDNSDSKELSKHAGPEKAAEIAQLEEIIDNAVVDEADVKAEHNKFDSFTYYKVSVDFGGTTHDILLNVGHGKFDAKNHFYAITDYNKKRATAGREALSGSVDNRIRSDSSQDITNGTDGQAYLKAAISAGNISKDSIHQNEAVVNTSGEKKVTAGEKVSVKDRLTEIKTGAWMQRNIEGFDKLNATEQLRLKSIAVSAKSSGLSDEDARSVARVAARSGLDFVFDRSKLRVDENGKENIADGMYKDGKIYIDPQSERAIPTLLSHELVHAVYGKDAGKMLKLAYKNMSESEKAEIKADYGIKDDTDSEYREEIAAHYAEKIMGSESGLAYLWSEEPTLKEKILDFFKGAQGAYAADEKLDAAARKFARQYRNLFKKLEASGGLGAYRSGEVKYSITEPLTDKNGIRFENAVLLDTDFFDGISPRNWGQHLKKWVNSRAANDPAIMPITDENGNTTILQFAKPTDKVKKDGGNIHYVLDELSYTSDNLSKLAVIHIDEIVSVSEENSPYYSGENSHGWLDKNGWLHRSVNVINAKNGNIYNLTFDIAKASDGRTILYATDGKIKKVGHAEVNSLKIKGSGQHSNSKDSISQNSDLSTDNTKKKSLSPDGKASGEIAGGQYQGRGYDGHSMSVNARIAYGNGEMPISKWKKSNILEAIEEIAFDEDIPYLNDNFNKLTLDELRGNFLKITSWHHTGQFYNQTDFWSINEKAVKYALENGTEHIISERKPKQAKPSAEKQAEIDNKKALTKAYDIDRKLELVFISGVSGLKTKGGLVKRYLDGKLDLSTMYYSAIDAIHKKDSTRIDSWKKLPDGHWRKEDVKLYLADKEGYVIKEYLNYYNPHSNANIQKIKNKLLKENVSQVATNNIGTFDGKDPDIRYAKKHMTKAQQAENARKGDPAFEAAVARAQGQNETARGQNETAQGENGNPSSPAARELPPKGKPKEKPKMPGAPGRVERTVGELGAVLANSRRGKVYSRGEALEIINKVPNSDFMTAASRERLADELWSVMNRQQTKAERAETAHDIAIFLTDRMYSESRVDNPDAETALAFKSFFVNTKGTPCGVLFALSMSYKKDILRFRLPESNCCLFVSYFIFDSDT